MYIFVCFYINTNIILEHKIYLYISNYTNVFKLLHKIEQIICQILLVNTRIKFQKKL